MSKHWDDVLSAGKKDRAMGDTWGHLYPEENSAYTGYLIVAHGTYGEMIVLDSQFEDLGSSPMRYHLERTVFDKVPAEFYRRYGVYKIDCVLHFGKGNDQMYSNGGDGGLVILEIETVLEFDFI